MPAIDRHETWFFIQNPKAGDRLSRRRIRKLRKGLDAMRVRYQWQVSSRAGELSDMAAEAVRMGYQNIIVVGGDGSLNEVLNGILGVKDADVGNIILSLFPAGTGNDWSRTHRIPKDPGKWLTMFAKANTCKHDVGVLSFVADKKESTRYFLNVAGLAYDGFLVKKAGQSIWQERFPFYYLLLALSQLFQYRPQGARIIADGKEIASERFYTINLGICRYSGGGMSLTPHADPSDRKLALTLIRRVSRMNVLLNTWRFYFGKIGGHRRVSLLHARKVEIGSTDKQPLYVEADGEFLGTAPLTCTVFPESINILVPE